MSTETLMTAAHPIPPEPAVPVGRDGRLTYGSICSGIEAASVAWAPLGWSAAFVSEIEAAPRAVLQHRFPKVPLHGDFTTIQAGDYGPVQLLVGGTPCQSFSVAGLRGGLADDRGNLALQYLRLADRLRPRWLVWENVPGVLSSNGGRDFGAILGGMVELGYGFAYRVLDALDFGCPLPRPRVFVVGYFGDWRPPAQVLLQRECLGWCRETPDPRLSIGTGPVLTRLGAMAYDDRTPCVLEQYGPRRTTPLEWERALGFPDGWTAVPWRSGIVPDGPRYKMLGNSMAVNCMRWIGRRIEAVDALPLSPLRTDDTRENACG